MRLPRHYAFVLALVLALTVSCRVSFSDRFEGTELFKKIELAGERLPGAELSLTVSVNQAYPVPVHIACYYEDGSKLTDDQLKLPFEERALTIGEKVLPAAAGRRPGDKVPREQITFRFRVLEPGDYFLACLTPAAPDNGLALLFTVKQPEAGSAR